MIKKMGNLSKRRLSILSVKFTEQQQKRNEKYNKYVEHVTPTHSLAMNMFKAFYIRWYNMLSGATDHERA